MGQSIYIVDVKNSEEWMRIDREEEMLSDEERAAWMRIIENPHETATIHMPWHDNLGPYMEPVKRPNDLSILPDCIARFMQEPTRFAYLD